MAFTITKITLISWTFTFSYNSTLYFYGCSFSLEQTTNSSTSENTTTEETTTTTEQTTTTIDEYDGYYQDALGKTGTALKTTLHEIIDDHQRISYSAAEDALMVTDKDPDNPNNIILFYSGRSQEKNTDGCCGDDWNREHVWAKSHGGFDTEMGPGTDLHQLRPTDASVNGARGTLDFDNGGFPNNECIIRECLSDGDSWEPDDEVKGDVARILFYMVVRYEGDDGFEDLELNERLNNSSPYHGKLSTLLEWHELDPEDDFERNRNEIIYIDYQHNRNPFIDHPEWVNEIWN